MSLAMLIAPSDNRSYGTISPLSEEGRKELNAYEARLAEAEEAFQKSREGATALFRNNVQAIYDRPRSARFKTYEIDGRVYITWETAE